MNISFDKGSEIYSDEEVLDKIFFDKLVLAKKGSNEKVFHKK